MTDLVNDSDASRINEIGNIVFIPIQNDINFEDVPIPLRDLMPDDFFISKAGVIGQYLENLGEDKHLLKSTDINKIYVVPVGSFLIYKMKAINNR